MTPQEQAQAIKDLAHELGVRYGVNNDVLTVRVTFEPGDTDAYIDAERACLAVLRLARANRPGSIWGTDSGSIGGHIGLKGGYCTLHKSGVAKRVLQALSR